MSELLAQILEIQKSVATTAVTNSQEELSALIQSIHPGAPQETDPQALDDVINNYMDRFDRLKFLFLEQESKEQFLRLVLEQNTKEINREAILEALEESNEKKKGLEKKKEHIDDITKQIETTAKSNYELMEFINRTSDESVKKMEIIKNKQFKVAEIESELKMKLSDPSLNKLKSLSDKLEALGEVSFNDLNKMAKLLKETKSKRLELQSKILKLQQDKADVQDKLTKDQSRLTKLLSDRSSIDKAIANMKKLDDDYHNDRKGQILLNEEKVLLLLKIWPSYSNISQFEMDSNVITYAFKGHEDQRIEIHLVDGLKIESVWMEKLEIDASKEIVEQANKQKVPLFFLSNELYKIVKH